MKKQFVIFNLWVAIFLKEWDLVAGNHPRSTAVEMRDQ